MSMFRLKTPSIGVLSKMAFAYSHCPGAVTSAEEIVLIGEWCAFLALSSTKVE
jgi:hypothetical protein